MTALAKIIRSLIEQGGPMPIDRYMSLCLGHPEHGYYMTRDPFGTSGDFTTAPEVSQVFGELIGVWCVSVWQAMGSPRAFALVELGPGRGTLMADVLRVASRVEALAKGVQIHLVETSPVLREAQRSRVPKATWHASVASLPALPTIIIANEFFDALPIRQFERRNGRVFERCVGLMDGQFVPGLAPSPYVMAIAGEGVFEDGSIRNAMARQLGDHLQKSTGAALIIDYGHLRSALGETLQALRSHAFADVLQQPGNVDLTSHVDFEQLARGFATGGAKIAGVLSQSEFLMRMGLEQRTTVLARTLQGEAQASLHAASTRLASPAQMGHLFKVLAVTGGGLAQPYPFGET